MSPTLLQIHPEDSVAVVLADLSPGHEVALPDGKSLLAREAIPAGHKIALYAHANGDLVRKYGQAIGIATRPIAAGDWVHSHNLATRLAQDNAVIWQPEASAGVAASDLIWHGYDRGDGATAGTRNEIWILPTVGCVARTAQRIASLAATRHPGRVDGIHAFVHPFGCSQLGDDLAGTRAILAQLAANPNAAGVLLIGLGCESNQMAALLESMPVAVRARVRSVIAQDMADETAAGLAAIDDLVATAAAVTRTPLPLSRLRVGLKCGGSDGFSGLTANPLLGRFTETLVASGGSAILTEIPEIFGAEQLLMQRADSEAVFLAGLRLVADFKAYFRRHDQPVSENPSPGNLKGGITTLEEKSLGAIQKAGRAPIGGVVRYGQAATAAGVTLLEAPGNDAVSSTALAAAGANLLLFTTGRGTPLGFPVPTIKVASNSDLARRKPDWIDFDAGAALAQPLTELDTAFLRRIVAIASGEPTAAERSGEREIAIWKRGVTL
ncbi:MAG: altronate dehydratase family protein [Lysobacteraceae bacterium]